MNSVTKIVARAFIALPLFANTSLLVALPTSVQATETTAPTQAGPQDTINDVSKRLFAALDSNRASLRKHPESVYPIIDQILLPHFDADYATQLVLAQHWRDASPEQRQRFIDAFHSAVLRTYGSALIDVTADRVRMLPFRGEPGSDQATVHTEVTRDSGSVVHVDYRLRRTPDGWKAFDIVIEGISYVRSYRTDLDSEISAKGLDAVITRLETQPLKAS
jgi:phospholipid transport system substrate-binding protein